VKNYLGIVDRWGNVRIREWKSIREGHGGFGVVGVDGKARFVAERDWAVRFRVYEDVLYWWRKTNEKYRSLVKAHLLEKTGEAPVTEKIIGCEELNSMRKKIKENGGLSPSQKEDRLRKIEGYIRNANSIDGIG